MRLLPDGLRQRLLIVAAALYALVCGLSWLVIDAAVERPARRAVDGQMEALARDLRGRWTTAQITGVFPPGADLGDLHWSVADAGGGLYLSAVFDAEAIVPPDFGGAPQEVLSAVADSPIGALAYVQQVRAELPPALPGTDPGDAIRVVYTVAMSAARHQDLIAERADALRQAALRAFAVFGFLMLGLIVALVALVLTPLRRLERAAERYGAGETPKLEGRYPSEIEAVVQNLNTSIDRNAKLVERTRRYIGKIAHDLKHPLAVTRNALAQGSDVAVAETRLDAMDALLDRYAGLARSIGPEGPHPALAIEPFLEDARAGFLLLYRATPLTIDLRCEPGLTVRVAETDLDAIVANLMTNAHRHARSRVLVSVERREGGVRLAVEDDGPGLDQAARGRAIYWGERLDTAAPGSGFGLAIVSDLAALYGGELMLDASDDLGGLRAVVDLIVPAARGSAAERGPP